MNRRALTLLAVLLAGCTVGPTYKRPDTPLPPSYAEPHAGAGLSDVDLASWWSGIWRSGARQARQPRHCPKPRRRECGGADQARPGRKSVSPEREPSPKCRPIARSRMNASANMQFQCRRVAGGGGNGTGFGLPGSEFTTFRVGFDASWELDLFGKTRREIEAARARTGAAIWSRRDAEVSTAAEVASAYLALALAPATDRHRASGSRAAAALAAPGRRPGPRRAGDGPGPRTAKFGARSGQGRHPAASGAGRSANPQDRRSYRRSPRIAHRRSEPGGGLAPLPSKRPGRAPLRPPSPTARHSRGRTQPCRRDGRYRRCNRRSLSALFA